MKRLLSETETKMPYLLIRRGDRNGVSPSVIFTSSVGSDISLCGKDESTIMVRNEHVNSVPGIVTVSTCNGTIVITVNWTWDEQNEEEEERKKKSLLLLIHKPYWCFAILLYPMRRSASMSPQCQFTWMRSRGRGAAWGVRSVCMSVARSLSTPLCATQKWTFFYNIIIIIVGIKREMEKIRW